MTLSCMNTTFRNGTITISEYYFIVGLHTQYLPYMFCGIRVKGNSAFFGHRPIVKKAW
jgi:hypothetical protein